MSYPKVFIFLHKTTFLFYTFLLLFLPCSKVYPKIHLIDNTTGITKKASANKVKPNDSSSIEAKESAVTYTLQGRLGDSFISFLHALWVSYKHKIPLLYKTFPYSDQLMMHELLSIPNANIAFKNQVKLKKNEYLTFNKNIPTLYIIPYFPESLEDFRVNEFEYPGTFRDFPYFAVDWEDKGFIKEARKFLSPRNSLNLITPPCDCMSIAIHVRKNSGGFDLPLLSGLPEEQYNPSIKYVDRIFPLKHPPDEYYIEQIKTITKMFPQRKFYIYIFTDDPAPEKIAQLYAASVSDSRISFDYRRAENNHYSNVLEDFFSMLNFDCLIRPDSNLSIVASKIGNFKILITPVGYRWEKTKLIIEKVSITLCQH